jgi:hypothetical protein
MFKWIGRLFIITVIFFAVTNGYAHWVNGYPTGTMERIWM